MTTTVVNLREVKHLKERGKAWPEPYVYIGRPSKWDNPYPIGKLEPAHIARARSIAAYRNWLLDPTPERIRLVGRIKEDLRGKVLVCWCKPLACHGDVLAELADS